MNIEPDSLPTGHPGIAARLKKGPTIHSSAWVVPGATVLGDVILAEPKALIGFAGPRVIEQTIRQKLPEGFQRSEFLLEHGTLDMILDRRDMRDRIADMLRLLLKQPPRAPTAPAAAA